MELRGVTLDAADVSITDMVSRTDDGGASFGVLADATHVTLARVAIVGAQGAGFACDDCTVAATDLYVADVRPATCAATTCPGDTGIGLQVRGSLDATDVLLRDNAVGLDSAYGTVTRTRLAYDGNGTEETTTATAVPALRNTPAGGGRDDPAVGTVVRVLTLASRTLSPSKLPWHPPAPRRTLPGRAPRDAATRAPMTPSRTVALPVTGGYRAVTDGVLPPLAQTLPRRERQGSPSNTEPPTAVSWTEKATTVPPESDVWLVEFEDPAGLADRRGFTYVDWGPEPSDQVLSSAAGRLHPAVDDQAYPTPLSSPVRLTVASVVVL